MRWFETQISGFLDNPGQNNAERYGVSIIPADRLPGQPYWRVLGVHHLTGSENGGNHHAYLDVLNEHGKRLNGARLLVSNGGRAPYPVIIDKPKEEAGANVPMYFNDTLRIWVAGDIPSEEVTGIHTRHEDEEPGTTRGHHSFYAVFGFELEEPEPEPEEPPEEEEPTPGPVEDWRAKLGVGQLWLLEQHLRLRNTPESELVVRMAELLDGAE